MDNICIKLHSGYPTGKHQVLQKQRSILNRSATDPSVCCTVFPSPETDRGKSLIQLLHLRPSSPPLFICPFSVFSPYIFPSIAPLCLSLSPLTDQLLPCAPPRPGPAHPSSMVPQVNQRCPRHTQTRKGPASPYGLTEKTFFCTTAPP